MKFDTIIYFGRWIASTWVAWVGCQCLGRGRQEKMDERMQRETRYRRRPDWDCVSWRERPRWRQKTAELLRILGEFLTSLFDYVLTIRAACGKRSTVMMNPGLVNGYAFAGLAPYIFLKKRTDRCRRCAQYLLKICCAPLCYAPRTLVAFLCCDIESLVTSLSFLPSASLSCRHMAGLATATPSLEAGLASLRAKTRGAARVTDGLSPSLLQRYILYFCIYHVFRVLFILY